MPSGRARESKTGKYLERGCIKGKNVEVEERRGVERIKRRSKDALYIMYGDTVRTKGGKS